MFKPNVRAKAMQKYNERECERNVAECGKDVDRTREPGERPKGSECRKGSAESYDGEVSYKSSRQRKEATYPLT